MKTLLIVAKTQMEYGMLLASLTQEMRRICSERLWLQDLSEVPQLLASVSIDLLLAEGSACTTGKEEREVHQENVPYEGGGSIGKNTVRRVQKLIEQNYMKPYKVSDYAEMVNVSEAYLCKIFKRESGITICDFMTVIRMERAAVLLLEKNYPVREIAEMVGYRNFSYFDQRFRNYKGMTPKEYRLKNREKNEGEPDDNSQH